VNNLMHLYDTKIISLLAQSDTVRLKSATTGFWYNSRLIPGAVNGLAR